MASVSNVVIHDRSGAQVSEHEMKRIQKELFDEPWRSPTEFRSSFKEAMNREIIDNAERHRGGGFVLEEDGTYRAVKGAPSLPDLTEQEKDAMMLDDADIDEILGLATPEPDTGGGDPLAQARAAIAGGANKDAVISRLKENGIDPTGL